MKNGRSGAAGRDLGQLFEGRSVAGLGEVQLLRRFVERRDELAFAALVGRHGPMVLGVCRRLLADPHDVEDAFQATFLVLVRRAGSLRDGERLAPWLFGVARRVATRARRDLARRRAKERPGPEDFAATPFPDPHARELGRALVEEIDRLPVALRDPILLCCVEGLSYDEAATKLRSTAPAVRGRLARARERLRGRLTRRGFAPSVGSLHALLTAEGASAAIPSRLLLKTIRAESAGTVPAGVEILAEGVIRTMILTKSKFLAAVVIACGVAGSSVGLRAQDDPTPAKKAAEADRLGQVEKKLDRLLRALEKPTGPTDPAEPSSIPAEPAAPAIPSPAVAAPAPTPAPAPAPAPPAPIAPTPPAPPRTLDGPGGAMTIGPMMREMMGPRVIGDSKKGTDNRRAVASSTRIDAMERKLVQLEARLANVERRLGPERKSEGASYGDVLDPFTERPVGIRRAATRPGTSSDRRPGGLTQSDPNNVSEPSAPAESEPEPELGPPK